MRFGSQSFVGCTGLEADLASTVSERVHFTGGKELEMKKMVAMVAFATALMIGGSAMAAPVDIFVTQTASGSSTWEISAVATVSTGQIALVAVGFSSMSVVALPTTSLPDSIRDPGTGNLTLTSVAGNNLVAIGGGNIVLATLLGGPTSCPPFGSAPGPRCGISSGDDAFGFTVLDQALGEIVEYSLTVTSVPEPGMMVLLGIGLAAMATVRRAA